MGKGDVCARRQTVAAHPVEHAAVGHGDGEAEEYGLKMLDEFLCRAR